MNLEQNGRGRNITLQVLDAIMCHNGELELLKYYPKKKTKGLYSQFGGLFATHPPIEKRIEILEQF